MASNFLQAAVGSVGTTEPDNPGTDNAADAPDDPNVKEPLRSQKEMILENKPFKSDGIPMNFQFVWRVARRNDPTMTKKKCLSEMVIERWKCTETELAEESDIHTNFTAAFFEVYDYYTNVEGAPPVSMEVFTLPKPSSIPNTVMYPFYESVKCVAEARKKQIEAARPNTAGVRIQLLLKQMQAYFTKARISLLRFQQRSQIAPTGFRERARRDNVAIGRVAKPEV